ncbi:MAG: prolipoprotein diacylglyceryl transferase [Candidatus Cloacimonadaceae bacterium]|nr:prolipoprotein diacylglyceryl transferase [Candidatus Cloacimonadota bacterium]MCK9178692.1 prolipoprotein diacylglyceryl transferase [Candidatus Cloacimonadota bacterium]MDD3533547.1 prolipoprotein diacylglyceryl transferase [Candidatus Cloacimonadota bacterium]MDY0128247.1 prolipoprotein diacylglyceryl transferase [Candidatus Cloacimonadaceae bacterium]
MIRFPDISPEIASFRLFGLDLHIRWYGFLYVLSFVLAYLLYRPLLRLKGIELKRDKYESLIFYIMLGVILGGRLGYVLFYNFLYYLANPLAILAVWEGGMSFHGGALGVIIAGLIFCRQNKLSFLAMADPAMPIVGIGLALGRLGNFINAELWGKVTTLPWGVVFPAAGGLPRHPTQLYEMLTEGLLLGLITYYILRKNYKAGLGFWTFIGGYGIVRFLIEFVRVPDDLSFYQDFGFIFGFMSIGQFLSLLMIIASGVGIWFLYRRKA